MAGTRNPWEENYGSNGGQDTGAKPWEQSYQEPEKPKRTWGEAIKDTGAQLAEGVNTTLGAIPSVVAPQSKVAGFFRDNAEHWRDKQSDVLKGRIAETDKRIQEAGKDGVLSQIGTAASEYWNDPAQAARLAATNLPSMAATLGTGAAAGLAAKGVAAARGLDAANKAALAAKYGTTTAAATNAALNAGGARGEAFEDLQKAAIAQGMTPEQAEQAGVSGSILPGVVGGVAGAISGKIGLEKAILGQATTGAAMRKAAGAFGAELAGEQIEELAPKVATNYQVGRIDPGRTLTDDLGRTVVETAIGSGPGAVVAGGASAMRTGETPPPPGAGEPTTSPGAADPDAPQPGQVLGLPAPDRGVIEVAGDGTARTPAYQAPGYVGDVTDVEPRAVNPVREQVAAAAEQGGSLSSAALTAIDTGLSDAMQPAPEQAPPQISLEEADARDQAAYAQHWESYDADPVVSRYFEDDSDIPDFGAASNVSDEEFLRSLGATDEDIQDAIATARQPAIPQSRPAVDAGAQANEPAGPREGAGGNQAAPGQVTPRQPENFTGTPSATMGKQGATARPGPAFGLKDALAQIRAKKQQEAANAQATAPQAAPASAPVPAAGTGAVEAAGLKPAGQRQLSADEQAAQDREEARAKEPSLPPVLSARLQEAHKAHGRDVKRSVVERSIANEKANNTGTPKAKRERADRIARLEADLALFDEAAAMPPKEAAGLTENKVGRKDSAQIAQPESVVGEVQRSAAPSAITPTTTQGTTDAPQTAQAQQASPQPAQAAAAPAAGPAAGPAPTNTAAPAPAGASTVRALSDGAPAQNPGAQAAPAAGQKTQEIDNAQSSTAKALIRLAGMKGSRLIADDGRGRKLFEVKVTPEFRNRHFVNGRMPMVDGLELKEKSAVTGNAYDDGYILIDNREQLAARRAATAGAQAAPAAGAQAQAQGASWDGLDLQQRTAVLSKAGWRTNQGGLNVIGKRLLNTPWNQITGGVQEIIARNLESEQAIAATADVQEPSSRTPKLEAIRLGRNNTPLNEGGKPFKTRKAAGDAKKLQPMMRVVTVPGGYALAEKTPAQLAAEERASRRLRNPNTSAPGEPIPAHAFIAAAGGLNRAVAADLGVEGNPRIGNRTLFAGQGRGLSIEQATQMLIQDGYLSEGALHNDAYALIKTSLTRPQYNADGIERIAEAEVQTQLEDYLAAQEEAAAEGGADPFGMADEFTAEELDEVGYTDADPALQAEVAALITQAEASGIDTYAILEDIARTYANATQDQYNAAARDALAQAIARSNQDGGSTAAQAAPASESSAEQGLNQPEALGQQAPAATENVAPAVSTTVDMPPTRQQESSPFARFATGRYRISIRDEGNGPYAEVVAIQRGNGVEIEMRMPGEALGHPAFSQLNARAQALFETPTSNMFDAEPGTLELESLAPAEAAAQQAAQEQAAKAEAAAKRAEEAAAKAEEDRKRIAQASVRAADNFELGQDPLDSLTGQGSIFDAPEPAPAPQPITRADVAAAQQQAATLIAERIDAMTAGEVNTIARRFLPTMGVKPTVSKERNKAAVTDFTKVNPMAAAAEFGVTLPADVRRALDAEMQGNVADGFVEPAAKKPAAAPQPAAPAAPIEDAGEKIGGARKDRWKERGLNLDDLDAMTEAEGAELATKANVWKPDYEALAAQSEPVTAAMVKTIYDQLAAKPKKNTPEGRRQYVQMMRIVRDVLTEAKGPEAVRNAYLEIRKRAGLNAADPAAKAAGRELLFSVYKGRSDPFVLDGGDLMKVKKMVTDGFPAKGEPWKTRLTVGRAEGGAGTTERGIEIYMERSAEVGTPLTREQILDGFYRVSTKDNKTVAFAASKADAEAAAATVYERDMKGKKDGKPEPVRPNLDELKRENLPQRIDRDVTSEDFVRDLGFRGVEFGNWSAQDERQRILNMAYDGLIDLAEIMGVPPKAMSLNGTLGMAFGARGGGRFAAHYEPGKLVINMTKIRGGGSMAHEWAHAMDHYFGELDKPDAYTTQARGASGWYSEDQYNGVPRRRMERVGNEWKNVEKMRLDNLRPEMAAAFDEVMRALFQKQITKAEMVRSQELDLERTQALARNEQDAELKAMYQNMVQNKREALNELRNDPEGKLYAGRGRSDYAQQAQALSGKSVDGYWVRPTEMFARAFESWVFDRVTAMGAKSDYLVHGVEEDRFAGGAYKGNPYPAGEERARINAAFDKLAKTIQTKETDQGVAMFATASAPVAPGQGVTLQAAQQAVDQVLDGLGMRGVVVPKVVNNPAAAGIPTPAGVVPTGGTRNGEVYLFTDNLHDDADVFKVVFHELFHLGLSQSVKPKEYIQTMLQFMNDPLVRQHANAWKQSADGQSRIMSMPRNNWHALAVEEALADIAEDVNANSKGIGTKEMQGWVRRTIAWLADLAQSWKMPAVARKLRGMTYTQAEAFVQETMLKGRTGAPVLLPDTRFRTTAQSIASSMGDMTPDQEKAYKNVAGVKAVPTVRERMDALKANLGLKLRQGLVDQFAAIKQLDQNAYVQARMSKGTDGTLEAILMYGKPFMRDGAPDVDINDGGFAKVLASLKGEQDRWMMWIAAQRAEKLKAEGKENLMTDDDISALKTLNAGRMADGTARTPVYAKALAELNEYNDAMLKLAMDSGLIDQDAYDLMAGQPYVPFYRLMEDGDMKGPKFSSGLTNQKAWQKLKGGTQQLNADLLQNMLLNWSHLLQASAKNRAATATMDAAEKMAVAYKVDADTKGSVKVMRDGSAEHWMVEDPYLLDAISAIHYVPSPLMKPLAKFKQLLTWGVTVNPTFKIRNLIRDSVSAIAQSELGYNPGANVAKGWKLTAKDSQIYASMLASGGLIKFGTQENTDRLRAQVAKLGGTVLDKSGADRFFGQIKDLYDVYNEFGDRAENVNRAALYDALIKKGKTHAEAAFMARDLMDFSMGGSAPVVRFLTQTVPFLNARLVGLDKLGRAAMEDPRRFAAVTGAVALASLALLAAYSDDDDWKKREDWDRDAYWWFKIGGQAYRIPKPFEVGAIGTLAERTAELMFNDEMTGKRYMERVSHMLSGTFSFNPVPQAFKPLLDLYANKDSFTGRAIESQADQRLRPQDRYSERTPEVAKFLGGLGLPDPAQLVKGEYSALSPKQVEHLIRGYFSWVGTAAMTVSDLGLRPLAGRGERPDMRLKDVFIAGNFVENLPTGSSRYVTQMYEQSRQVEQAYASYQEAIKAGDTEKAQSIKESAGPLLRNRPAYTAATRQLAEINRTAKRVEADQAMAGAAKRARLTQLEQQRHVIAQRVSRLAAATP